MSMTSSYLLIISILASMMSFSWHHQTNVTDDDNFVDAVVIGCYDDPSSAKIKASPIRLKVNLDVNSVKAK